ncbi:MAG: hypothetical protein ETSY2_17550 [Candidatus Entotheonella gemina]|uniref:Uncharacterized protein n=1 Tax=Candidatus Entotheonella gemina TaxID=1429439 RepID=W4M8Y2_9BACT|nr:MAG: hypothetical protein ETSY2_17550 [Candidatus Entotheonella gemina]
MAKRIIAGRPYLRLCDFDRVQGLESHKLEVLEGIVVFERGQIGVYS